MFGSGVDVFIIEMPLAIVFLNHILTVERYLIGDRLAERLSDFGFRHLAYVPEVVVAVETAIQIGLVVDAHPGAVSPEGRVLDGSTVSTMPVAVGISSSGPTQ